MKPSDIVDAMQYVCPRKWAVYVWGAPGIGKSQITHQLAAATERRLIDWRMLYRDPVDARGVPSIADGKTVWNPPFDFPTEGKGILFLDELAQAPPMMQQIGAQIALERRCGDTPLGDDWWVVCASNRTEDRAGTHRLISNASSRFVHLDMEVSHDDWQLWAVGAGIHPAVRSFLRFKPGLLYDFDPARRCNPLPRTWHQVSDVFWDDDRFFAVVAGCVGEGPAAEFVAFLQVYKSLPDVDQVLSNPTTASVPKEPSVLYALSGAIVERCRKADGSLLGNAAKYTARMSDEFSVLTVRDIAAMLDGQGKGQAAKFLGRPEIGAWLKTHRHLLLAGNGQ